LSVRATVFVPVSRRRGTVAVGAPDEAWAAVAAVRVGGNDDDDADVADGPRGGYQVGLPVSRQTIFYCLSKKWDLSGARHHLSYLDIRVRNFRLLGNTILVKLKLWELDSI
jgi:hypothetical protein